MTNTPGGTFGATMQEASSAVVTEFDAFGPFDPHTAALKARNVAGEVASPGTGLFRTCGVFGEERSCECGSITGCENAVSPGSEGIKSPRLCEFEPTELSKENSRGSLKMGGDDFARLSASAWPLRFFG